MSQQDSSDNEYYTIRELACNLRDAVVLITGQAILKSTSGEISMITRKGNGVFIKGHYIICPADIILIPTSLLDINSRIPEYQDIPTNEKYPNAIVRVTRILVDISNVNGCGKSYSYEANLIGIDGAANIAILRIDMDNDWNRENPHIRICHPVLQWGKSRNTCPGDTIIAIGNIPASADIGLTRNNSPRLDAENGIAIGNIADNRYIFPGGQIPGELILLSNMFAYGLQNGLPILTVDGVVIGMTIHLDSNYNYNLALSEFFMRRSIRAIICSYQQDTNIPKHYQGFIKSVSDPIGNYYRFNKSWLGLGGILMDSEDYDTNIQVDTVNIFRVPVMSIPSVSKEIVGYRILVIAGPTAGTGLFIPGTPPESSSVPILNPSPLYGLIESGDIITHINGCPLGDRKGQISPSLVMWRVKPGDPVTIIYKKQSELFEQIHEITVRTGSYEPFLDYPFYALDHPNLRTMLPTLI